MGMLKKARKNAKVRIVEKEEVWCSRCGDGPFVSDSDVHDLVCGYCMCLEVMKMESTEAEEAVDRSEYPRGWHRRTHFEAPDGRVYKKGKEVI